MVNLQDSYRAISQQTGSMASFAVNAQPSNPGFWDSLLPQESAFPAFGSGQDPFAGQNPFLDAHISQVQTAGGPQRANSGLPPWGASSSDPVYMQSNWDQESSEDGSETSSDDDEEILETPGMDLPPDQQGQLLLTSTAEPAKHGEDSLEDP